MKANALAISLILLLVPLAGCSGTDTEVTVDMDSEDLQAIIDDNRDDFLNNTTVVVFQEYHNNTTVVNQYSNNTTNNMDQSGTSTSSTTYNYNGSAGESELFVIRLEFDFSDVAGEIALKRNNNFTVEFSYFDYATNNDRTDNFTLQCSNYYEAPVQGSNSTSTNPPYWNSNGDVQDDYTDWWDYLYNNTIRDLLTEMAYNGDVEDACREDDNNILIDSGDYRIEPTGNYQDDYLDYSQAHVFLQMNIDNGTALNVIEARLTHRYTDENGRFRETIGSWTVNGWSQPYGSSFEASEYCPIVRWWYEYEYSQCGNWYGGWDDLSLTFQLTNSVYYDSEFSFTMYYEIQPISS